MDEQRRESVNLNAPKILKTSDNTESKVNSLRHVAALVVAVLDFSVWPFWSDVIPASHVLST